MNFLYRYLMPFLPFFLIASFVVIGKLRWPVVQYSLVGLIFVSSLTTIIPARQLQERNREVIASQDRAIAWISTLPSQTTISMTDMGRIPYYTGIRYNDIWGLVDIDIAHNGYNTIREFLHLPDYFVLVGYIESGRVRLRFGREQYLIRGRHFTDCYQLERICLPDGAIATDPGYYYVVFKRLPNAQQTVSSYGEAYWKEHARRAH